MVTYNSVFVVDLSCVRCIDLHADYNRVWIHGGKPRRKYVIEIDSDTDEVINAVPEKESTSMGETFTFVRLYTIKLPLLFIEEY